MFTKHLPLIIYKHIFSYFFLFCRLYKISVGNFKWLVVQFVPGGEGGLPEAQKKVPCSNPACVFIRSRACYAVHIFQEGGIYKAYKSPFPPMESRAAVTCLGFHTMEPHAAHVWIPLPLPETKELTQQLLYILKVLAGDQKAKNVFNFCAYKLLIISD